MYAVCSMITVCIKSNDRPFPGNTPLLEIVGVYLYPFLGKESPEQGLHVSLIIFLDLAQDLTHGSPPKVLTQRMDLPEPPKMCCAKGACGYIPAQLPQSFKKYILSTYYVPIIVLGMQQ